MATESWLVTALPYSASPAEPFHVSLFVTHRLTPDGAEGVVGDFRERPRLDGAAGPRAHQAARRRRTGRRVRHPGDAAAGRARRIAVAAVFPDDAAGPAVEGAEPHRRAVADRSRRTGCRPTGCSRTRSRCRRRRSTRPASTTTCSSTWCCRGWACTRDELPLERDDRRRAGPRHQQAARRAVQRRPRRRRRGSRCATRCWRCWPTCRPPGGSISAPRMRPSTTSGPSRAPCRSRSGSRRRISTSAPDTSETCRRCSASWGW